MNIQLVMFITALALAVVLEFGRGLFAPLVKGSPVKDGDEPPDPSGNAQSSQNPPESTAPPAPTVSELMFKSLNMATLLRWIAFYTYWMIPVHFGRAITVYSAQSRYLPSQAPIWWEPIDILIWAVTAVSMIACVATVTISLVRWYRHKSWLPPFNNVISLGLLSLTVVVLWRLGFYDVNPYFIWVPCIVYSIAGGTLVVFQFVRWWGRVYAKFKGLARDFLWRKAMTRKTGKVLATAALVALATWAGIATFITTAYAKSPSSPIVIIDVDWHKQGLKNAEPAPFANPDVWVAAMRTTISSPDTPIDFVSSHQLDQLLTAYRQAKRFTDTSDFRVLKFAVSATPDSATVSFASANDRLTRAARHFVLANLSPRMTLTRIMDSVYQYLQDQRRMTFDYDRDAFSTSNDDALLALLRGTAEFYKYKEANLRTALSEFRLAERLDPTYSQALVWQAYVMNMLARGLFVPDSTLNHLDSSSRLIQRATQLGADPKRGLAAKVLADNLIIRADLPLYNALRYCDHPDSAAWADSVRVLAELSLRDLERSMKIYYARVDLQTRNPITSNNLEVAYLGLFQANHLLGRDLRARDYLIAVEQTGRRSTGLASLHAQPHVHIALAWLYTAHYFRDEDRQSLISQADSLLLSVTSIKAIDAPPIFNIWQCWARIYSAASIVEKNSDTTLSAGDAVDALELLAQAEATGYINVREAVLTEEIFRPLCAFLVGYSSIHDALEAARWGATKDIALAPEAI